MHPLVSLGLLSLIPSALAQVNFTQPDINKPLNLSSEAVTIAWKVELNTQEARDYQFVDIWWITTDFGYELVENFTHSVGTNEYVWNAAELRDHILRINSTIPAGKSAWFELRFHDEGERGSRIESEKYVVEGYPLIAAGHRVQVGWGIGLAIGAGLLLL